MTLKTIMDDDLASVFFNTDEFAVEATYIPFTGIEKTINVIFDKEYESGLGMAGTRLSCEAMTTDVAAAVPGETLIIEGTTYKIKEPPHHTASGTSIIELSED